jgi:hypothetical protein
VKGKTTLNLKCLTVTAAVALLATLPVQAGAANSPHRPARARSGKQVSLGDRSTAPRTESSTADGFRQVRAHAFTRYRGRLSPNTGGARAGYSTHDSSPSGPLP